MIVKPYYSDDAVTLYHGDCREMLPLSTDVLITDPPYPGYDKGWEVPDVAAVLSLIEAKTKVVCWPPLVPSPLAGEPTAEHVWHKTNGRSSFHYERVLVTGEGQRKCRVYPIPAILPNYVQYAHECVDHPTQKPLRLMLKLVAEYPGAVLDPFAGSGTTLVAAKLLGRYAIGVEQNEAYCEIIAKRLAQDVFDFGAA
jgi:DNA modification methylase